MTNKYQSPIGHGMQFFDANGDPLSGGKLYTYQAGTTTDKAAYKDNAGAASHTNPVVLGADGFVPGGALWLDTDVAYKFTLKSADDAITYFTVDNVAGLADKAYVDSLAQDEWISGPTPTFIDATSFSVSGDQTTALHAGRAIKLTDSSTLYGVITAASYSAGPGLTTVTVLINDGTDLSGSLSAIAYGFQSATENQLSLPAVRRVIFLEDADHDLYLDADYVIDPTTTRTLTLQNSYKKGMRPRVVNLASDQKVQIDTQDGDTKCSFQDGEMELRALQDTPTDKTHWRITQAKGGAAPGFSARLTSDIGSADYTTPAKIPFSTEIFDTNSDFDATTNYRFTCAVPGKYRIVVTLYFTNIARGANAFTALLLYKDGSSFHTAPACVMLDSGTDYTSYSVLDVIIDMAVGEYFEVYVHTFTDTTVAIKKDNTVNGLAWNSLSRFEGHYIDN